MSQTRRTPAQRLTTAALVAWPVVVAMILGLVLPASSAGAGPEVIRAFRVYGDTAAFASCGGDTCVGTIPTRFAVDLPSVGTVAVTASLTLSYSTSPGDAVRVTMRMSRSGQVRVMAPGTFQLEPSDLSSTTLSWVASDVRSAQRLVFIWGIGALRRRLPPYELEVTKALLEITVTPA